VLGLTRTAAAEVAGRGIRVNAVLPGMIDTRMLRDLAQQLAGDLDAGLACLGATAPAGRTGQAEEVATVVAFLCSDAASFVHGVGLPVDGGILATLGNAPPS
jgi:3alpha(or 20beta)-hydroxysteroid dehydrogenase